MRQLRGGNITINLRAEASSHLSCFLGAVAVSFVFGQEPYHPDGRPGRKGRKGSGRTTSFVTL